ncbi:MAG: nonstructural protein [Microvirus sp.]|nr:MAG: nonstructural protein [Microvirus sp.]
MKNLYSIYDKQLAEYSTPWVAQNDNAAKRAYERLAADSTTDVNFRPTDFDLFSVGYFDEESGLFESRLDRITPVA